MGTFARSVTLLCCLLAGGLGGVAHAIEDPDTEAARRHFVAGAALYDDAKYAEAIVELAAARRLRP